MTLENIAATFETTLTLDDNGLDDSSGGTSNKSPVYKNLPIDGKIYVMENTTHVIDIDSTDDYDSEGNGLKYYIVGGVDKDLYTIDQHTGKLSFINPPDFENPLDAHKNNIYDVIVRVVDSHGAYTDQSLWVHVTDKPDTNNAPNAVDDHYTVMEGGDINLKTDPSKGLLSNDTDADHDTLRIKAVNGAEFTDVIEVEGSNGGKFTVLENGGFKFWAGTGFEDLNAGETRDTSITYTIDDGNGGMDTATVKVTVTGKDDVPSGNNAPVAVDDTNSTAPGQKVGTKVLENDSDPDGDPLRIKSFTQAANGTVKLNNNGTIDDKSDDKLVYTPNEGFTGIDTFTYAVADPSGAMDMATVTIEVGAGNNNNAPIAVDDYNTTTVGQKVGTKVLANDTDPDSDPLRIKSFTQAANGTVKLNNNGTIDDKTDDKLVYLPNEGFAGTDTFTYTIADPSGAMDTATVTIDVIDPNPAPKITAELVGTTSIHEGDQGSYKIQLDQASDRDRTFTIEVNDGTANRVNQYAADQDIIWGGFYDIRNSSGEVIKVVENRVPNSTDPADGDRPAFGLGDASWDYTVYQDDSINTGNTITVTVAAGETMSNTFEVQTWLEEVTVDRDGPNSKNFLENTENFSIKVVGTDDTMFSQDSLQVEILDKTHYGYVSPIVVDLNGDGIQTISIDEGVEFDIFNTGEKVNTGWLSGNDGFLAVDNNGNGLIENQDELFGGAGVGDAFEKLASYDSNNDGVVNALDDNFGQISVWQDANENGLTDLGELQSLNAAGISELSLDYQSGFSLDPQGNVLGETSTAVVNGETRDLIDVYFEQL